MTVICVNNLTYGMTGGQLTPTTPEEAIASTTPYGNFEQPFNLPYLAESCGAVYVARWTTYHVTQLKKAMKRGAAEEGLLVRRGHLALPDALRPPQPDRRRRSTR